MEFRPSGNSERINEHKTNQCQRLLKILIGAERLCSTLIVRWHVNAFIFNIFCMQHLVVMWGCKSHLLYSLHGVCNKWMRSKILLDGTKRSVYFWWRRRKSLNWYTILYATYCKTLSNMTCIQGKQGTCVSQNSSPFDYKKELETHYWELYQEESWNDSPEKNEDWTFSPRKETGSWAVLALTSCKLFYPQANAARRRNPLPV